MQNYVELIVLFIDRMKLLNYMNHRYIFTYYLKITCAAVDILYVQAAHSEQNNYYIITLYYIILHKNVAFRMYCVYW